jgi:hypothetical protein
MSAHAASNPSHVQLGGNSIEAARVRILELEARLHSAEHENRELKARLSLMEVPEVMKQRFEITVESARETREHPAEYSYCYADDDVVLDSINVLLERHDDELAEIVTVAQIGVWRQKDAEMRAGSPRDEL